MNKKVVCKIPGIEFGRFPGKKKYESISNAVRIGMQAYKVRKMNQSDKNVTIISPSRKDQRVFPLCELKDVDTSKVHVVLNGIDCKEGRDFLIATSPVEGCPVLHWTAENITLYKTDQLAIGFGGTPTVEVPEPVKVDTEISSSEPTAMKDVVSVGLVETTSANHSAGSVTITSTDTPAWSSDLDEEVEDIDEGAFVYHRLTGEGPWIVVQPCTLKVTSSQGAGGNPDRVNETYVESAWTVMTGTGLADFPEVVLTLDAPEPEAQKPFISDGVKTALKLGLVAATVLIVYIPWAFWVYQIILQSLYR